MSNKDKANRGHAVRVDRCFWLYLLECENGSFYTGYTKNLAIRYYQHKNGKQSARYTRSFKPIKIAQCWRLFDTIGTALKVERFIKNQDRKIKLLLVENPEDLKSCSPLMLYGLRKSREKWIGEKLKVGLTHLRIFRCSLKDS